MIKEHRPGNADHGKWNFPCGFLDLGEDPYETAIRETREEAGYDVRPHALLGIYSVARNDIVKGNAMPHYVGIYYIGAPLNEVPYEHDSEVAEIRWLTPDEALAFPDELMRSRNIKIVIKDYAAGTRYPLEVVHHMDQVQ